MLFNWTRWFAQKNFPARERNRSRRGLSFSPRVEELEARLAPATISPIASLIGYPCGATPVAGLVEDANGNLFGTTSQGGPNNDGTVFEVNAGSGTFTTLVSFDGTNGASPLGTLIEDGSGDFFGMTAQGGANGDGTVFEVKAGSNTITTLASLNSPNQDQVSSNAHLIEDGSGNLFGTTYEGGANGKGMVFEVAAGSGTLIAHPKSSATQHRKNNPLNRLGFLDMPLSFCFVKSSSSSFVLAR